MPPAEIRKPAEKHTVDTNIAQRGPRRSTIVPPNAAERPSMTIASWKGSAVAVPERPRPVPSPALSTLHA